MATTDDYTVTVKTVFDKAQTKKDWNKLLNELQKEVLLKVKLDNKIDTTQLKSFQSQLIEISKEAVSAREAIRNMGMELSNVRSPGEITIPITTVQKQGTNAIASSADTTSEKSNIAKSTVQLAQNFNTLYLAQKNVREGFKLINQNVGQGKSHPAQYAYPC